MSKKKKIWISLGILVIVAIMLFGVARKNGITTRIAVGIIFEKFHPDAFMPKFELKLNSYNPPCKDGDVLFDVDSDKKFCYKPSGHEGEKCTKKSDCGSGGCLLTEEKENGSTGVCKDLPFGCNKWISNNGKIHKACVD